jgi:hypothetical protein
MKKVPGILVAALLMSLPTFAQAPKPCDELKSEIAQKLDAKQVKQYTLEIVPKDLQTDAKVVGTCEAGTKKIVYRKADAAAKPPASPAKGK